MEDMLCAMALKSANGRHIQHTQARLLASRVLRAGAENHWKAPANGLHTGGTGGAGAFGKPPAPAREKWHFGVA
jgi:hypothetical protein